MKYRKKPVVIEAIQWDGTPQVYGKIMRLVDLPPQAQNPIRMDYGKVLNIHTLEGVMIATEGDWIIKGIKGELYPCKPDIFEQTYEKVEETE